MGGVIFSGKLRLLLVSQNAKIAMGNSPFIESLLIPYGLRHADKAGWFAKCPKCGAQIGIKFKPKKG